jgi:phosphonate transport system substrate-binding protein
MMQVKSIYYKASSIIFAAAFVVSSSAAFAASRSVVASKRDALTENICDKPSRLSEQYEDANCDLLADKPSDLSSLRNPETLVWAYTPIEDPVIYAELFKPFTRYLASCVGRQIVYYPVQSEKAQIKAFAKGRLHFAGFATGATVSAVEIAAAQPFAAKGTADGIRSYRLISIVRAESSFEDLKDLTGYRVAHTTDKSNSGNHAARYFFPEQGLKVDIDYKPIMSGGHSQSILGVLNGDYDMAAVASDVFERMVDRGSVNLHDFRIIYESPLFPTSSFVLAHDLDEALSTLLKTCFFNFRFPAEMSAEFQGDNQFLPINYESDWQAVRDIIGAKKM